MSKAIDKARHDDVTHVTQFLRRARGDVLTGDIVRSLGFAGVDGTHGVSAFFSDDPAKARVPSPEHWEALRRLLGFDESMDDEVRRLNGRKGSPSDDYLARPAASYDGRPGMAESWRQGKGWTGTHARGGDPVRDNAASWLGWGTALKPAFEPIVLCRKPLSERNVAANVLKHGTGAINIDASRIAGAEDGSRNRPPSRLGSESTYAQDEWTRNAVVQSDTTGKGRWPANVILSHASPDENGEGGCERVGTKRVKASPPPSGPTIDGGSGLDLLTRSTAKRGPAPNYADPDGLETVEAWTCVPSCPIALLDAQSGDLHAAYVDPVKAANKIAEHKQTTPRGVTSFDDTKPVSTLYTDTGGASRYFKTFPDFAGKSRMFYTAKASRVDRDNSRHPTIKPTDLMAYLVRLVTPPGGLVLDPFCGSGPTIWAAREYGFKAIGIDREREYLQDTVKRLRQGVLL